MGADLLRLWEHVLMGLETYPLTLAAQLDWVAKYRVVDAYRTKHGLRWDDGAFVGDAGSQTIADLALYAHGTGALPPGVEGGLDAQTVYRDEG